MKGKAMAYFVTDAGNVGQLKLIALASGVLAFLSFNLSLFVSIQANQKFVFLSDFLSDLGVGPAYSAAWFNYGLMLAGALVLAMFSALLKFAFDRRMRILQLGALFGMLCAVSLASIGVFPENQAVLHALVSNAFFFSAAICAIPPGFNRLCALRERVLRNPGGLCVPIVGRCAGPGLDPPPSPGATGKTFLI